MEELKEVIKEAEEEIELHCTTTKKSSLTLTAVGDSRVIWRPKNDAVFIFFYRQNLGFLVRLQPFPWENYEKFKWSSEIFFPGIMSSLVLYESLTSISLPGSPNNASFSQGI